MSRAETAYTVALQQHPPKTVALTELGELILDAGDPAAVFDEHVAGADLLAAAETGHYLEEARAAIAGWEAEGWRVLDVLHPEYPDRVRAARRPPALLVAEGALMAGDSGIAVVGSREATSEGLGFAATVARHSAELDITVVSGLAAGVDAVGMTAALDAGGRVVAVMGTGHRRTYPPENGPLRARILDGGGLVLSQFLPDFRGAQWAFPARNKTMSAYAWVTVIADAAEKSGTKHQALEAISHGRRLVMREPVASTSWGAKLVGRPDVFVAASAGDAVDHLEEIAAAEKIAREIVAATSSSTTGGWW